MRSTNHKKILLFKGRCKQLVILLLICMAKANVFAQTISYVSGSPCYGQTVTMQLTGATATNWYTSPTAPAGAITNNGNNTCTISCTTTGTFTLYATYINGPNGTSGTASYGPTVVSAPPPPIGVTVTASASSMCWGGSITYTAHITGDSATTHCYWYINNDGVTYGYSPVFTTSTGSGYTNYFHTGSNTVECYVYSTASCGPNPVTSSVITQVDGFDLSPSVSICAGSSTTLTATGGSTYTWSPATGLSATTGASVVASPTTTTTYTVTANGCTTPKTVTVTVNPISAAAGSPCAPPSGTTGGTFGGTSIRNGTPVVLTGSTFSATKVNTFNSTDMVGFAYNGSSWTQVPIQVDEKKTVNAGVIYNTSTSLESSGNSWGTNGYYSSFSSSQYCDPNTWVGADTNPAFDSDDELVFMARDAGGSLAPDSAPFPTGVDATVSGAQIKLTDPNNSATAPSYLYIFKKSSTSTLQQSAGKSYVNYNFVFKVGSTNYGPAQYKTQYISSASTHYLENSVVNTPYYQLSFSDRWIEDFLKVTISNSAGIDLIDRHRNQFSMSDCENEDSFSICEGAFIVNKSGPIRAIRSYMGACSGPLTQREHYFYDQFEVIKTNLRVHQLPDMYDFWDYNPGAGQMRYSNNNNTTGGTTDANTGMTGIPVDGTQDVVTAGVLNWELMSSASGSVFRNYQLTTNITPFALSSYYVDTNTPSTTPGTATYECPGGDGKLWGASGLWIKQSETYPTGPYTNIPITDPRNTTTGLTFDGSLFQNAQLVETNMFLAPATNRTQGPSLASNVNNPLTPVVSKWPTNATYAAVQPNNPVITTNVINVYPNPSNGMVNIEVKGASNQKIIAIFYNPQGLEVYRTQGVGAITQTVNLHASFGIGKIYIAKFYIGNNVYTRKLIVNN